MPLPLPPNTTCAIYRAGRLPPQPPDLAGIPGHLHADFRRRLEIGEGEMPQLRYTHLLLVDLNVDIRDGFTGWPQSGPPAGAADTVYIPDPNGTPFIVRFVERRLRGTPTEHLRVYLDRGYPPWPTDEL